MKPTIVLHSQTQLDGRLDAGFHLAVADHRQRAAHLESLMDRTEALAKLEAFPKDLVHKACFSLATGGDRQNPDDRIIQRSIKDHPFLAMAMIEAALPEHLKALEAQETKLRQARQSLEESMHTAFTPPRRPRP